MPTRTREKPQTPTRERILAAAEKLFAEEGFDRVSMPAIAKASGITAGAIYKHFASKEDLFFDVVRLAVQEPAVQEKIVEAATDLPRVIAGYTTRKLKLLRQLSLEMHAASATHPKVRRFLRQSLDRQMGELTDAIADAQRCGTIARGADAAMLANTLFVFLLGLMHMETLLPQFVDDAAWHDFVQERVAVLLGVRH